MKIHSIVLKDYQQFKDLEIDLTYPLGHEKAGQPLDKVCFIGQSGTGKTTLLRLIKCCVTQNPWVSRDVNLLANGESCVEINYRVLGSDIAQNHSSQFLLKNRDLKYNGRLPLDFFDFKNFPCLVDFPAEVNRYSVSQENNSVPKNIQAASDPQGQRLVDYMEALKAGFFVDLNFQGFEEISTGILEKIGAYQANEVVYADRLKRAVLGSSSPEKIEIAKAEYQAWASSNQNPLEEIAVACEHILDSLGVRVKTEIDLDTIQNLGSVRLQTLAGANLPPENWSTGIRQIVYTAAPMVHLHPNDAIILIDEPEKSLYPDIQSKIIDFYTSLTTDCQFFYATHSPIIASSFDPWEIVELKFDETNQFVVQETNFVGERHVDNYTVYPKYLKWDGILMKLFDLMEDGNSEFRTKALMDAASLEVKLDQMKENGENKGPNFEEILAKFIRLKDKIGWE